MSEKTGPVVASLKRIHAKIEWCLRRKNLPRCYSCDFFLNCCDLDRASDGIDALSGLLVQKANADDDDYYP